MRRAKARVAHYLIPTLHGYSFHLTAALHHPPFCHTTSPSHPTVLPVQDDDIPGIVRYRTYEVLKEEANNPRLR